MNRLRLMALAGLVLVCSVSSADSVAIGAASASASTSADVYIYLPLISAFPTSPQIAGCDLFPADNMWNTPVDTLPVDANSDAYVASIGAIPVPGHRNVPGQRRRQFWLPRPHHDGDGVDLPLREF